MAMLIHRRMDDLWKSVERQWEAIRKREEADQCRSKTILLMAGRQRPKIAANASFRTDFATRAELVVILTRSLSEKCI